MRVPKFALSCLAMLCGLSIAQPVWSQDQEPPESVVEDVVVEGRRSLAEAVRAFVDQATEPPTGRGPATWDRAVCVGVVGLRRDAAQVLIDRVSAVADDLDLEPGEPGCRPNIVIVATDDASELSDLLVEMRPNAFRPNYAGAARSRGALDRFRTTDDPVRWWHVSIPVERDTGRIAVRLPGRSAPKIAGGGLLTGGTVNRLVRTIVILDIPRLEGATFQQLGDYVSMVALAQIDPEADMRGFDSVLNLFRDPAGDDGLTDWDTAYLRSLYRAELRQRSGGAQLNAVGARMLRERRSTEQPVDAP